MTSPTLTGRDLDRAVAEARGRPVREWAEGELQEGRSYVAPNCWLWWPLPYYSTRIACAWELVEEMRAAGFEVDLAAYPTTNLAEVSHWEPNGRWNVCRDYAEEIAETMPLAISRAYLAFKESTA